MMKNTDIVMRNLLDRQKVSAWDNKVVVEFKNPIREYRVEYKYSELKPTVVRGKSGDPGWTDLGKFFTATAAIIAFGTGLVSPNFVGHPYYKFIILALAAVALVAFSLRLIKHEEVWFVDKHNNTAFIIKLTSDTRIHGEYLINYIIDKTKDRNEGESNSDRTEAHPVS